MRPHKLRMFNIGPFTGLAEIDFTQLDDIFLISGKTGSGKTTIYDALCFALYGKLPGSRKNLEPKIRSDFANPNEDSWVELEFSLANRVYLVQRSPKMVRPKKRGMGTTVEEENAVLYQFTETGEKQSLSNRKSEADERVAQLLGLSAEEFAKIVLLPQGEFAQFLQQNSQARREVLRKLFPVDEAAMIRELAMEKKKEAEALVKAAQQSLEDASSRYNETENKAEMQRIQERLRALEDEDRRLVVTIKTLSEQLFRARQKGDLQERLEAIAKEKSVLDSQRAEIAQITQALERNQRAKPAQELLFRERELEQQGKDLSEKRETAKHQAEATINQYEAVEMQQQEMEALAQEAKKLREQKGALAQASEEEQRLLLLQNRLEKLRSDISELAQHLPHLRQELSQLQARLEISEQAARDEEALQQKKEWNQSIMEQLRNLRQTAESWEQKESELRFAQKQLGDLETELAGIERRLPELASELSQKEKIQKEQELKVKAAQLAATLKEGSPCPVCGSMHHPLPARAPAPQEDLESSIGMLKKEQRSLEDRRTELRTEIRNKRFSIETHGRELAQLKEHYRETHTAILSRLEQQEDQPCTLTSIEDGEAIPTVGAVQEDIRKHSETTLSVERSLQQAGKESRLLSEIHRSLAERQQQMASLETKLEQNKKLETELILQIDERKGRLEQYLELWKTETISLARNRLESRLATIERDLSAYEEQRHRLAIERAQALQRQEEIEKSWRAYEVAVRRNQQELSAKVTELSFVDTADLKQALLTQAEEAAYTSREREWKETLSRLGHQEEESRRALERLRSEEGPDSSGETAEELQARLAETEEIRRQLDETRQALQGNYLRLEQDRQRYQEALNRFEGLNKELARYRSLADDLSGSNPKRWPFDSWLLSLYLQEVTGYANRRLERMSEGRYSIILNPEGEGGRSLAGLDLAVFDSFTGKTRPCATLSGGESFMASISLALGLADSIQSRSGAVRLEAIFIDEGFGSLDETSLDRALTILDEIRDHRMVGLISHVGEMKNRIPSNVEVIKSNQGSKILIFNKG